MPPNENARKNHDELFPGDVSTLSITDPEVIETFDNFAFDEVLRHGNLDTRTRLMIQLASIIASQAVREYRAMVNAMLIVDVDVIGLEAIQRFLCNLLAVLWTAVEALPLSRLRIDIETKLRCDNHLLAHQPALHW